MDADFTESIKQWVAIDNQIKKHNERLRELRCKEAIFKNLFWSL